MDNKANVKLREWLKSEGRKSLWIASKLHTSPPTVSTWLTGKHKPHWAFRMRIEEITEGAVNAGDWGKAND